MARIQPKMVRFAVPVVVAGVAAATIGLGSALAGTGDPELPEITAEELLTKIASSDTQALSGSVRITTDFGLPSFTDGALAGVLSGAGSEDGGSTADPKAKLGGLLAGTHTLRVAVDGPDKQRVSIVEDTAEYTMIHNGGEVWAYDSGSHEAYHGTLPGTADRAPEEKLPEDFPATPQAAVEQALKAVGDTTTVSVDGTAKVAGRDAYQLRIAPKQSDSTIGEIRIAVDSRTGVPLKFTLLPKDGGKAAVDVAYTKVDFGPPDASTFEFTPPKGAKVTEEKLGGETEEKNLPESGPDLSGFEVIGEDWDTIAQLKMPKSTLTEEHEAKGESFSAGSLLGSFGEEVKGDFGTGTVLSSSLVNALITDDGTVYVGAVTGEALVDAANAAE